MKLLRRMVLALVATMGLASGAHAQIPVTDAMSLAQQIQQVMAWAQQYQQMVQQYQTMTNQLNAIKGGRGMGQLLNLPGVRQELPTDFLGEFDRLRNSGAGGASNEAQAIYASIQKFNCTAQFPTNQMGRLSCEASAMVHPTNLSLINRSIASSQGRVSQLQGLMGAIDGAQDIKAAQDLSNRINIEMALLHNEKAMMDMALAQQERQAKLLDQQKKEAGIKRLTEAGFNPFARQPAP